MSTRLTQDALERHLWAAADILRRSPIDNSDAKKYILGLLLLKRLSDRFEEESEIVRAEGGDPDDSDEYQFFVPSEARWRQLMEGVSDVGTKLNKAVAALERSNPKLEGTLYGLDFNDPYKLGDSRQRDQILSDLIHHFSRIDLRNATLDEPEMLGRTYESLIARFANDSGRGGEFFTPPKLACLLAEILQPREGMRICDPACGTGGMLIQCADYVQRQGGNPRNLSLYGQEKSLEAWSLGRMNMLLRELEHEIVKGDTIREPKLLENGSLMLFDIALSNPPTNMSNWGSEIAAYDPWRRFRFGMPPPSKGDFAFLQHMIATLTPTGRMAVLVNQGVLSRGQSEADIRRQLIENDLIESVVALPPGVLYPISVAPAILVINRAKSPERVGKIFFVDASKAPGQTTGSPFKFEHLAKIPEIVAGFRGQDGYTRSVLVDEVASHGFSLKPGTYLIKSPAGERLDRIAEVLQSRIQRAPTSDAPDIPVVQGRDLGVRRLAEEDLARWPKPSDLSRAVFVRPGDILLQRIGDRPKAAIATNALDGTLASDTVFVIRLREEHLDIGPFLVGFLNSPEGQRRLANARTSAVIATLNLRVLRALRVPLPDAKLLDLLEQVLGIEEDFYDRVQRIGSLRSRIFEAHDTASLEAEARQLSLDAELLRESVVRSADPGFQIRNFYPHMIAYGYRQTSSIFDPEKRYRRQLLGLLDALIPFLGSIGLMLVTSLARSAHLAERHLGKADLLKLWTGGATLGKWVSVWRNTAGVLRSEAEAPASRAFSSMWGKRLARTLDELVAQRNEEAHRPKAWSKRDFEDAAHRIQCQIEEVLKASLFFVQHPIRLIEGVSSAPWPEEGVLLNTLAYKGDHPSLPRELIKYHKPLAEGHLFLELAPGSWLSLYPLLSVEDVGGQRRTYAIDKLDHQRLGLRALEDGQEATPAHLERIATDFRLWLDRVYKDQE